jgi:hypothetical protein
MVTDMVSADVPEVPTGHWQRYAQRYGNSERTRRRHLLDIRLGLLRRIPGGVPDATQFDLIQRRVDLEGDLFDAKRRREMAYAKAAAAQKPAARDAAIREALEYERRIDDRRGKIELNDRHFAVSIGVMRRSATSPPADPLDALHGHLDGLGSEPE